jgi:hypothetical protein
MKFSIIFIGDLRIVPYAGEEQLAAMTELITKDLSEPYSIYTYRYFLHTWPKLSFLVCRLIQAVLVVVLHVLCGTKENTAFRQSG